MTNPKFLILAVCFSIVPAYADPFHEQLMISINKLDGDGCEAALTEKLVELKLFLNFQVQEGGEHYASSLLNYIDYTTIADHAPYYGVAIVELEYSSSAMRHAFVDRISKDGRYLIYANGPIDRPTAVFRN